LLQGEGAADIGVEDEETVRAALQDGVAEVVETASRSESLVLAQVFDRDLGVSAATVLDEVAEDCLIVVTDNEDLANLGEFGDGSEAV
jgi:hypothetical protein